MRAVTKVENHAILSGRSEVQSDVRRRLRLEGIQSDEGILEGEGDSC